MQARSADEGELDLEVGHLTLGRVRARSDRGAAEDPVWTDVVLEIDGAPLEAEGLPATYGGVLLEPAADACGAELVIGIGEVRDVTVCLSGWAALDLRCPSPSVLRPDERTRIEARLDTAALVAAFEDEAVETGERVDRDSHPAVHAALLERWADAWSARCDDAGETGEPGS